jgi:two-component system cell cycle response regulator DivK
MEVKTKKVLIIDDDSRNIFALSAVLRAKKFTCLSASSAKDGFDILVKDDKDVACGFDGHDDARYGRL